MFRRLVRTLLPGRIADQTQKSWVMQGRATGRATTADGRWVYTIYQNPAATRSSTRSTPSTESRTASVSRGPQPTRISSR